MTTRAEACLTRKKKLRWRSSAALTLMVERGRRRLAIIATDAGAQGWLLVAIEGKRDADDIEAVFGDHAHKDLGRAESPALACKMAEMFADAWQPNKLEQCACPEIEGPRSRPRPLEVFKAPRK